MSNRGYAKGIVGPRVGLDPLDESLQDRLPQAQVTASEGVIELLLKRREVLARDPLGLGLDVLRCLCEFDPPYFEELLARLVRRFELRKRGVGWV